MPDAKSRIEQLAAEFVSQLHQIARDEVIRVLEGRPTETRVLSARPRGRPSAWAKSSRGEKRAPEVLETLRDKALAVIRANPGLRIEEINKELGLATGELALPIKKLLADKAIRTMGARRATRYYVAGRGKKAGSKTPSNRKT